MQILIDTNIIFKANFFRSTSAQALLKAARFLGFEIVIPEIVIDEVKGNFPIRLTEKVTQYKKSHAEVKNLIELDEIDLSIDEKVAEYVKWFDIMLDKYGVKTPPYPEIPLKEIIAKSYKKGKPFKENGEGHKDYLVWQTIRFYIESQNEELESYFLTENVKDFCEKQKDKWILHKDLSGQIQNQPKIYPSLKNFFDEKIGPYLQGIQLSAIPDLSLSELNTKTQEILEEDLSFYSAYGFEGLGFANDITIVSVQEVNADYNELKELDEDEILITVYGNVLIEVHGFIDRHDFYHSTEDDEEDLYIIDSDWNDYVMAVGQTIYTPFELALSYSKKEKELTGHTINLPGEIFQDYY